mgnify:CR=1 FL=1
MRSLVCEQKRNRAASIGAVSALREYRWFGNECHLNPNGVLQQSLGCAVTTAHPRRTPVNPMNPNGVPHHKCEFFLPASHVVEPRLGFGEISIFLLGVRRKAATPGFVVEPVPG